MNHYLGRDLWAAFFLGALSCSALAKDARVLLTQANLDEADAYYRKKWNDGMPFIGGGVSMPLPTGEEVSHREILMFVRYLWETRKLPSLEDLEPLLQDKNMACRVFCFGCLSAQIPKLPAYSPYFPAGSEPEKVAAVRAAIAKAKADLGARRASQTGTGDKNVPAPWARIVRGLCGGADTLVRRFEKAGRQECRPS